MKLDKFVSDVLLDIVTGVSTANKKLNKKQFVIYNINENSIEFDIAITVSEGKTEVAEGSLGARFNFFGFGLSQNRKKAISDKSLSRIKFKIKPRLKID